MLVRKLFPYPSCKELSRAEENLFEFLDADLMNLQTLRQRVKTRSYAPILMAVKLLESKGFVEIVNI